MPPGPRMPPQGIRAADGAGQWVPVDKCEALNDKNFKKINAVISCPLRWPNPPLGRNSLPAGNRGFSVIIRDNQQSVGETMRLTSYSAVAGRFRWIQHVGVITEGRTTSLGRVGSVSANGDLARSIFWPISIFLPLFFDSAPVTSFVRMGVAYEIGVPLLEDADKWDSWMQRRNDALSVSIPRATSHRI